MLIRIINGTYGHSPKLPDGRKSPYVIPTNRKSGPIDVEKKEAERLVEAGIAEYVTEQPKKAEKAEDPQNQSTEQTEPDLGSMSVNELKAHAQELGIDTAKLKTKAALIEAIVIAVGDATFPESEEETPVVEADQLPEFDAQDVVD